MKPFAKPFFQLSALLGTVGLLLQLVLLLQAFAGSTLGGVIQFFSYFTILSNTLFVLVCMAHGWGGLGFFGRTGAAGVAAGSMLIVGVVYHLVLDALWQPQGWAWVANHVLHTLQPLLAGVAWMVFLRKKLDWKFAFVWLLYPLFYVFYTLVRGRFADWYPYPFVDVNALGMRQVLLNSMGLAVVFYLVYLATIALGRRVK